MKFKDLNENDLQYISAAYESGLPRKVVQRDLANAYGVTKRTIRKWANKLGVGVLKENVTDPAKILIYDIETPRLRGELWWSGKQYVNGNDIIDEPKIISISWKWFGEDKVHALHWDLATQCDKAMMEEFLEVYNSADVIVGVNNDRFDNRFINSRAIKHGLRVNTFPRSIDVQKQAKRLMRIPSYSLKYLCEYLEVPNKKLSHAGVEMWRKIQYGNMNERREYMQQMIDYNVGDIMATEGVFLRMIPVLNLQAHLGTLKGGEKWTCPLCGGENIEHVKTTATRAGTIQHIMRCKDDGATFKLSNTTYLKWLELQG